MLELHYPIIQFLIKYNKSKILCYSLHPQFLRTTFEKLYYYVPFSLVNFNLQDANRVNFYWRKNYNPFK